MHDSPLSITQVISLIKGLLEISFPSVLFTGEVGELTKSKAGHTYLRIKDESSELSAVVYRGSKCLVPDEMKIGDVVVCKGRPSLWGSRGVFQFILHSIELGGEGALRKKFLELKSKLEGEGIFDETRKRKLPFLPKCIGIVTSPTGAVIHDIMVRIAKRMPSLKVFLSPTKVQGEGAADDIVKAIDRLNKIKGVDVIIIARGGGSLQDLWSFNEEKVVRAVFSSKVPVVSAIGHEVDWTLCDFAADVRAPTPTAAAEIVVPDRADLNYRIDNLNQRLHKFATLFNQLIQNVDMAEAKFLDVIQNIMKKNLLQISILDKAVAMMQPRNRLNLMLGKVELLENKLHQASNGKMLNLQNRINYIEQGLQINHPNKMFNKGFAMVKKKGGIVRSIKGVVTGDSLEITLLDGTIETKVINLNEGEIYGSK